MDRQRMRSPLGHAIGLGSAKEGVEHWWTERVTAVALVPLSLWFVASYRQRLRQLHRLGGKAIHDPPHDPAVDRAVLSHSAWPAGGDRGLRPLRRQDPGCGSYAPGLLCTRCRGHRSHPADRPLAARPAVHEKHVQQNDEPMRVRDGLCRRMMIERGGAGNARRETIAGSAREARHDCR